MAYDFIKKRVHDYYWEKDFNCAVVTLKNLAEYFDVSLSSQVLDSAMGMHGAGKYGAQCGLVEGVLLFLGIYGRHKKLEDEDTVNLCRLFAEQFEKHFSSLECRILRPEGFTPENPPHLCESLTCRANEFAIEFVIQSGLGERR